MKVKLLSLLICSLLFTFPVVAYQELTSSMVSACVFIFDDALDDD